MKIEGRLKKDWIKGHFGIIKNDSFIYAIFQQAMQSASFFQFPRKAASLPHKKFIFRGIQFSLIRLKDKMERDGCHLHH